MAEAAVQINPVEATPVARTQELARTIKSKLAQGYTVESQTDTAAVLVIKGRKRWFRSSVDSRQVVTVDEFGKAAFEKVDQASSG
jgi:hypothetical protein